MGLEEYKRKRRFEDTMARVRERIEAAGLEVDYRRAEAFGPYLQEQRARFAEIIKKNNIRIE